jgi:hypothetical protein
MQRVMTCEEQEESAQQPNQDCEAENMQDEEEVQDTGKSVLGVVSVFFWGNVIMFGCDGVRGVMFYF